MRTPGSKPSPPALAVIVPTLDEAASMPGLLADLQGPAGHGLALEIVVSDGGSTDDTVQRAQAAGARVVSGVRGRGAQMNRGAASARAGWLLFLHADTRLPAGLCLADGLALMRRATAGGALVAGHYALRFAREGALFRHLAAKTRSGRAGTVHGDQGLLIHRRSLERLGGFDARLPFFEDLRLDRALRGAGGRWLRLPGVLETSARRFETEGAAVRLALMALMVGAEQAGLSEFLHGAPGLYAEQGRAQRLRLAPFVRDLQQRLAARPAAEQAALWAALGPWLRDQLWQLPHALDALAGDPPGPALRAYERWIEPRWRAWPGAAPLAAASVRLALRLLALQRPQTA